MVLASGLSYISSCAHPLVVQLPCRRTEPRRTHLLLGIVITTLRGRLFVEDVGSRVGVKKELEDYKNDELVAPFCKQLDVPIFKI